MLRTALRVLFPSSLVMDIGLGFRGAEAAIKAISSSYPF